MNVQPIKFTTPSALRQEDARHTETLTEDFALFAAALGQATDARFSAEARDAGPRPQLRSAHEYLALLQRLDDDFGAESELTVEGAEALVSAFHRCLIELEGWLPRLDLLPLQPRWAQLVVGVSLWAIRHKLSLEQPEVVTHALALLGNQVADRSAASALFGLTEGVIDATADRLAADLERSNPQRPWRVLHLNLAILSIKSEDDRLMTAAFDRLDEALPDEARGFYTEAASAAAHPMFPALTKTKLDERVAKWTTRH